MWLEFMKGDPNNVLARTQLKKQYAHLFPKPKELVCVYLDFSGVDPDGLRIRMFNAFNDALAEAQLPQLSAEDSKDPFSKFLLRVYLMPGRTAVLFVDEYNALVRDYPDQLRFIKKFYESVKLEKMYGA